MIFNKHLYFLVYLSEHKEGRISLIFISGSLKCLSFTSFDKEKKTNIMTLLESHKIINNPVNIIVFNLYARYNKCQRER